MCLRAPGVKTGTGKWSENPEKMLRECGVELVSHPASTCSCSHLMLEKLGYALASKLMSLLMLINVIPFFFQTFVRNLLQMLNRGSGLWHVALIRYMCM